MANKDKVRQELHLNNFGAKGWLGSDKIPCPECGRSDKSGILFIGESGIFSCMRCGVKKSLNHYLIDIGREDLSSREGYTVTKEKKLISVIKEQEDSKTKDELPVKNLPVGFRRIYDDEYLNSRGFMPHHYELFKPGITNIDIKRKHSIIFQIFDKNFRRVGWLSRSRLSKEWHKDNLRNFKEFGEELKLRYDNSPHTDFSCLLGGLTELEEGVDTVILVEGLFDKVNVDRQLDLPNNRKVKCIFTFGDTIKRDQIELLKSEKGVKYIYLLYDYGTIQNSKHYGLILQNELSADIYVCEIGKEGFDPGNLSGEEIIDIMYKSVSPIQFKVGKLNYV